MNKDEALRIALDAIKEALAQPTEQEPVAWMFQHEETGRTVCVTAQQVKWGFEKGSPRLQKIGPLYTSPPKREWVGLTDVEWDDLYVAHHDKDSLPRQGSADGMDYERAIEAILRERNHD